MQRAAGGIDLLVCFGHGAPLRDPAAIDAFRAERSRSFEAEVERQFADSFAIAVGRFHEQVGATPAAWIARARVRRAQRLLETTDLSIEQVAAEAGFGSAAVMRVHFGEVVSTSPLTYRAGLPITRAIPMTKCVKSWQTPLR